MSTRSSSSLGTGIFLAALGAILYWAVSASIGGVDLDAVGVILMVAGLVLAVFGAITALSGDKVTRTSIERDPATGTDRIREERSVLS